jgi:hypothetical protein
MIKKIEKFIAQKTIAARKSGIGSNCSKLKRLSDCI